MSTGVGTFEALAQVSALGLRMPSGKTVSPQTFTKRLQRKLYAGWVSTEAWGRDGYVRGDFEPLVGDARFGRAPAALQERTNNKRHHALDRPAFPLRRFVKCSWCCGPLTGSTSKKAYSDHRCTTKGCRGAGDRVVSIRTEDLAEQFGAFLDRLSPLPGLAGLFSETLREVIRPRARSKQKLIASLEARLTELSGRRERLFQRGAESALPREVFDEQLAQNLADAKERRQGWPSHDPTWTPCFPSRSRS